MPTQPTALPHVRERWRQRDAALDRLGYGTYRDYLRSPHWVKVKARYRESILPQACMCGEETVDLHHMTYERIGAERLADLLPLCRRCHAMVHELERRGEIALDLAGFRSAARAAAYAVQRERAEGAARRDWQSTREKVTAEKQAKALAAKFAAEVRRCSHIGLDVTEDLDALARLVEALNEKREAHICGDREAA